MTKPELEEIISNLDILSKYFQRLLNDESTEGVSTSSRTESGVSHGVSDRNASRSSSDELSEEVVGGTLALRTDDGNAFITCARCGVRKHNLEYDDSDIICDECYKSMESS